jgi:hypothetical protein
MTDIVEQLNDMANDMIGPYRRLTLEAAAEIERLTEEVNALRLVATAHDAEVERLRSPFMKDPKPDLRALLPELAVIRQVMKDPKP